MIGYTACKKYVFSLFYALFWSQAKKVYQWYDTYDLDHILMEGSCFCRPLGTTSLFVFGR